MKQLIVLMGVLPIMLVFLFQYALDQKNNERINRFQEYVYQAKEQAKQEGWSTAPDYVRQMGFGAGMGLPNMIKCSDKLDIVSVVNQGTQITMLFNHVDKENK